MCTVFVSILSALFVFVSNAEDSHLTIAANDGPPAILRHPSNSAQFGHSLCTVTDNLLYANGYFVREITRVEQQEIAEYETNLEDYNKLLSDFLRGTYALGGNLNWILGGGRMFPRFHHQAMPRRPSAPSFCTGRDTVVHRFNGCAVQNYRLYIGSLYVRQLNDDEKRELDEYEYKMREYHQGLIDGFRKASGMWQPVGDFNIPYFHRAWDDTNGTSLTSTEHEVDEATTAAPLTTTTEMHIPEIISATDAPAVIFKPKIVGLHSDSERSLAMAGVKAVVLLALAGVVGLTLLVLGCALPAFGSWWPMFVITFYILVPIPLMVARRYQEDLTGTSACIEFALFSTTGIVISAFALPLVLAHVGTIKWAACFCANLGSVVMFSTILAYYYLHREDDSGGWNAQLF